MRIYEELFIVRPDAPPEEVDPFIEQLKNVIAHTGGTLEKVDKWGVRKLAYRVLKYNDGQYILLQFNAQPETVKEIERRLRVADFVLKFITVRIDERLKRIEKRKRARDKRAARRPAPSPSAPAVSSPSIPAEPGPPVPGAPGVPTGAPTAPAPPAERPQ
jgi:small subunit ribosomal protein S6